MRSKTTPTTRVRTHRRPGWLVAAAGSLAIAGLAGASVQPPPGGAQERNDAPAATPAGPQPVLLVEYAAAKDWIVDERDAALEKALAMIPARVRELPSEIHDLRDVPMPAIQTLLSLASKPGRLAVTFDQSNQGAGAFGIGLVFTAGPMTREDSSRVHATVASLLARSDAVQLAEPSQAYVGMSEMFTPFGPVRWGPRRVGDSWRYEIHAGAVADPDASFGELPEAPAIAPAGFTATSRGSFNLAPAEPLLNFFRVMGAQQPGVQQMADSIDRAGLVGENAVRMSFVAGHTPDAMMSYTTVHNAKLHEAGASVGAEPLPRSVFGRIPGDAVAAAAARVNPAVLSSQFAMMLENPEFQRGLNEFQAATGVDLMRDVVGSLGDVWFGYMSETTGGGGLASAVACVSLADAERFEDAAVRLNAFGDAFAAQSMPRPYFKGRSFERAGATFYTLGFQGLPVPLELTYAVAGDWLVLAFNPQAAITAVEQAGREGSSLLANREFTSEVDLSRNPVAVSFIDSRRTVRDGYGIMTMLTTAIGNAVRSPHGDDRDPGMIMPTYPELTRTLRPTTAVTFWSGNDLIKETKTDRSVLASGASTIGAMMPVVEGLTVPAMLTVIPALQSARESAEQIRRESERYRHEQPAF